MEILRSDVASFSKKNHKKRKDFKILVVIASYGSKNDSYLYRVINEYKSLNHQCDIVVLSNIQKRFGENIEVVVRLPLKNPHSLPFGYQKVFKDKIDSYDLFIYTEDDVLITEKNINSFLEFSKILPENEIPGFIRFEVDPNGKKYFETVHGHFHWEPDSIKTVGGEKFAFFTNEHSGCHILTKSQLKKVMASKDYFIKPSEGFYGMLETAATAPYLKNGLKKMICITRIDDFAVHHLPNTYIGELGVERAEVMIQVNALKQIEMKERPNCRLFEADTLLTHPKWNKSYYEPCRYDMIELMPPEIESVLSIGCGWGATEAELIKRNLKVAALPVDAVIGACAEARGVRTFTPDFDMAEKELGVENFDCLFISEVLHHLPDPVKILKQYAKYLTNKGYIVIGVPNFNHLSVWFKRYLGKKVFRDFRYIGDYEKSRLRYSTYGNVSRWMEKSGFQLLAIYKGEITMTTSGKEENLPLRGGLKLVERLRGRLRPESKMGRMLLRLIDSCLSPNIVVVGKKVIHD